MSAGPQRFSAEIPWVLVEHRYEGGYAVACEVCGAEAGELDGGEVPYFAAAHRVHAAPRGSLRLGDAVAAVAKPIARAFGQEPCTPCEARRRALNRLGSR